MSLSHTRPRTRLWLTRNTGLKTLFYNSFYLWLFKRHLISDKSETCGWCSCISSELIPGNHSKSQSQIRGFPLSKNSGWPAIKLSLVNRWRSQSEMLVTHWALISENQGLEKLRSVSNLSIKFRSCTPDFFFSLSTEFFSGLWYKSSFFFRWQTEKKIQVCRIWNFSMVWSRPWFFKTSIFRYQGAE